MKGYLLVSCFFILLLASSGFGKLETPFTFERNAQGIRVLEHGKPVFFYQRMPKSADGKYICTNYIHPLYSLNGDTLTEEFPVDHPYHRGIFWAWHQIYINGSSIGDGWIMENIEQEVVDVQTLTTNHSAQLKLNVLWKSPSFENTKPFLNEHTTITVYPLQDSIRKIDFAITLNALVPGLEIGGSNDEKGYGGLCARLKLPKDLAFSSVDGPVTPLLTQIKAGPYMDFSGSYDRDGGIIGVSILCHPKTPNYPEPWILRSVTSMQNVVFPGKDRISLSMGKPVVLYYRMIVHNGNAHSINLLKLQAEYEKIPVLK
jgi:hypothetical protein